MIKYGKTAQNAISAMSFLAEVYDGGHSRVSSPDIATKRQISKPLVAKLLVALSQADLVNGAPGPKGGYSLAKAPSEITLHEIVDLFEKTDERISCPFGPDWCGNKEPCPLHHKIAAIESSINSFLCDTTLGVFQKKAAPTTPS